MSPIPEGRLSRKLGVDGALSCWKIKDSPHISRTTGSVTGDNPLDSGDNSPGDNPPTENTPGSTPPPDPCALVSLRVRNMG